MTPGHSYCHLHLYTSHDAMNSNEASCNCHVIAEEIWHCQEVNSNL